MSSLEFTVDHLHALCVRTHRSEADVLEAAAQRLCRSTADAAAALRQYEGTGYLPRWADEALSADDAVWTR